MEKEQRWAELALRFPKDGEFSRAEERGPAALHGVTTFMDGFVGCWNDPRDAAYLSPKRSTLPSTPSPPP